MLAWYHAHQAEFDGELAKEAAAEQRHPRDHCVEAVMTRIRFYVDEDAAESAVMDGLRRPVSTS